MKCVKNEIYTERGEQVEWEKMVAAMLYSYVCVVGSEVCFILVTNDAQPVGRLDPLSSHSLWRRHGSI